MRSFHRFAVFLSFVVTGTAALHSADFYWGGASGGSAQTLGNWWQNINELTPASSLPSTADRLIFNTSNFTPGIDSPISTLGGNLSVAGLVFNSNSSMPVVLGTLNDYTLTIGASGIQKQLSTAEVTVNSSINVGSAQTWSNQSAYALTLAGNVALNQNLVLDGTGPILFTGTITNTGTKTLTVSSAEPVSFSNIVNASSTLNFDVTMGSVAQANGVISGSGGNVEKMGGGTLYMNNANSFTGNLRIRDGEVIFNKTNTSSHQLIFGAASGVEESDGFGVLKLSKSNDAQVAFNTTGTVYVHYTSQGAHITSDGNGSIDPVFNLNGDRVFMMRTVSSDPDEIRLRMSVGIANGSAANGHLTKRAQGSMLVEGVNTYTGNTSVDRGKLILDYELNNGDNKLSNTGTVNLRGGWLELRGNSSAATIENASALTVGVGVNTLRLNSVNGNALNLHITGNINRSANIQTTSSSNNIGVLNLVTDANSKLSVAGTSLANNAAGFVGGWFIYNGSRWASRSGNDIVEFAGGVSKTPKGDWMASDNLIVNGLSGNLVTPEVSSLIFDSTAVTNFEIDNHAKVLTVSQSAILVSDNSAGVTIQGGQLMTKNSKYDSKNELIITNLSNQTLVLDANLGANNTFLSATQNVNFASNGLIDYRGSSSLSGNSSILSTTINGQVKVSQVNAFGAYGNVVLGGGNETVQNGAKLDMAGGILEIGRLVGGRGGDVTYFELGPGEVALGTNGSLVINQTTNTIYSGIFTGTGTITKKGNGVLTLQNQASSYTGQFQVLGGSTILQGGTATLNQVSSVLLRGGALHVVQSNTNNAIDHIRSASPVIFQGTSADGLLLTSSVAGTRNEQVNAYQLQGGSNTITLNNTVATGAANITGLVFGGGANTSTRTNRSTLLVRGLNLGSNPAADVSVTRVTFNTASNITNALVGGAGTAAGSKNLKILPYAVGQSVTTNGAVATAAGDSFLTYDTGGNGLRTLTDTEYAIYSAASSDQNVSVNATGASEVGKTINSLRIQTSGGSINLGGSGDLVLNSGALLVTAGDTTNSAALGFGTITSGTGVNELVVSVTSSHANASDTNFTIESNIINNGQAVSLTKSGQGTLILAGNNSYTGETTINQGTLEFGATTGNLGSGTVRLSGGTLRWGGTNTTDISAGGRTVEFLGASAYISPSAGGNMLDAGNVFDIGANSVTLASAIGNNGYGGLTKVGSGTLTLSAAPTYKGATVVREGAMNFSGGIAADSTEALYLVRTASGNGTVSSTISGGLNVKKLVVGGAYGSTAGSTIGNLTVSSGAVNIVDPSGFVLIGYRDSSAGTGQTSSTSSTANFQNASSVNIDTAQIEIGVYKGGQGAANMGVGGSLNLSNGANTIKSGSIVMGHAPTSISNIGSPASITMGSSSNVIHTDTFVIGGARGAANVTIRSGGTFTLRGRRGGDTGANLFIGDNDITGTNVAASGNLDLSNASNVDARVNLLVLGRIAETGNSPGTGSGKGTLTFVNGQINATTILMSDHNYHNPANTIAANLSNGTIHQRGTATLRYQTLSTTNSTVTASDGANVSTTVANHNWQGGTLQNLAGDNLTNVNVTVNLNQNGSESLLDPTLRNFVVDAGQTATFQAEAEFAGNGSFTKNGAGDLILEGTNINKGNVRISQGKISLKNNGTMNDAAWFNIDSGAALKVSERVASSYQSDAVVSGTGSIDASGGTFTVGSNIGSTSTHGVIKPGASSIVNSAANAATVGNQAGTLQVLGNLTLAGNTSKVDRAMLQVGATDRNVLSYKSSYATREAWVDALPTYAASYLTGAGSNHDLITVTGSLNLDENGRIVVTALDGYTGQEGDVFNILDWGTVSGTLNSGSFNVGTRYQTGLETTNDLQLFALGSDLFWDTSLFLSHGVLVVVIPEPSRGILLLLAFSALIFRRKR